jgi:hypothetical protein
MNNKETFVEKLNECGEVKYEMSEVHSRILGRLKDVYKFVFNREKKDFLSLKNMMYFKAGVASPDARPRLHEVLDVFISLLNHYDFLGDDEIKCYLKEHGIEIELKKNQLEDGPVVVAKENTKNFERSWNFATNNQKIPETKKDILNALLDRAIEVQKIIEDKKEEVDKGANEVNLECQVKKPFFMRALAIKLKEMKKRSVDNELKRIEEDIDSSRDIIDVFDSTEKKDEEE